MTYLIMRFSFAASIPQGSPESRRLINKADFLLFYKGNLMAPSKQLRDMVLDIVQKNKDIGFDDIIIKMKKMVGIRGDSLIKLVGEILKWWEEGGKIVQLVDKRSKMGMYRVNENTQVAKDIVSEALGELGIFETPEESLTESDHITEARGYRKVKDLDRNKTLWELRTTHGMSYLIVSYSPQVDETAVFNSDRNGKVLSYSEVYSTGGRLEPEPIIRDIANGKIKPFDWGIDEAAKIVPPANLLKEFEKLINKYRDSGLKGANSFDRKTILDDEKELRKVFDLVKKGEIDKAWDAYENLDSELQLSVVPDRMVQFMDKNLSEGAKEIHKKLLRKGVVSPIDISRYPERRGLEGPFRHKKTNKIYYYDPKEGKYYDADSDIYLDVEDVMESTLDESVVAKKSEKFKAGIPKWFHTAFTGMSKYPTQLIAGWKTELKTGSGMPGYMTYVLHYDGVGTYTVYHNKGRGLKVEINGDKPLGKFRSPEEAMDFVEKNALSEKIK